MLATSTHCRPHHKIHRWYDRKVNNGQLHDSLLYPRACTGFHSNSCTAFSITHITANAINGACRCQSNRRESPDSALPACQLAWPGLGRSTRWQASWPSASMLYEILMSSLQICWVQRTPCSFKDGLIPACMSACASIPGSARKGTIVCSSNRAYGGPA